MFRKEWCLVSVWFFVKYSLSKRQEKMISNCVWHGLTPFDTSKNLETRVNSYNWSYFCTWKVLEILFKNIYRIMLFFSPVREFSTNSYSSSSWSNNFMFPCDIGRIPTFATQHKLIRCQYLHLHWYTISYKLLMWQYTIYTDY